MPKLDKEYAKKISPGFEKKKKNWLANPEDEAFYHSTAWRKTRKFIIARDCVCQMCKGQGREVDHIIPIRLGGSKLDVKNLQYLCSRCHRKKTKNEKDA